MTQINRPFARNKAALALPHPLPDPPPVPEPRDIEYPGELQLIVDATDVARRIINASMTIPVSSAGPMTLLHPKWLPGFHSPQAPIELLAGLEIKAGGTGLRWVRHPVTVNAFQIDVPEGVGQIEARYQFLSPTTSQQGRVVITRNLMMLPWHSVILYPGGHYARRIQVKPTLILPDGWKFATALDVRGRRGGTIEFNTAPLDLLVDSPVMAGRHFRSIDLDRVGQVKLNIVADHADLLTISPEQIAPHRAVVKHCDKLFGGRHFQHYDFLLALSGELSTAGVEHHQSCEAVSLPNYFTDWDTTFPRRDTFAHEYVHSWNGKHRRGADSWSPCFEKPIRNSLLWVYEGLTQYWTQVLAARSGLWTKEQALGCFAQTAATCDVQSGSRWRPLIDTTRDPIIAARKPLPWPSWQRSEDYYTEGSLIWLDVDTRLRKLTAEQRSLDDFARDFFGPDNDRRTTRTYVFDDVVNALYRIAPFDWRAMFESLITETREGTALGGLDRGGYRLVYRDRPNVYSHGLELLTGQIDFNFSIGLKTDLEGNVQDVRWEGPAFQQDIMIGSTIVTVNDRPFSPAVAKAAIQATRELIPLRFVIRNGLHTQEVTIDYWKGLSFPHLVRIDYAPSRIDAILEAS